MSESPLFRLRDPNPQIREQTLMELVFDPDLSYLHVFHHMLVDRDRDVRRTLMLALGALNHPDTLDALMQSLLDEDSDVVIAAEHALSKLDAAATTALWQWTQDTDWLKRRAALQALRHFDVSFAQVHPLLKDEIWEVRYQGYLLLGTLSHELDQVLPTLCEALQQEEHLQARDGLVHALGALQTPAACEILLETFLNTRDVVYAEVLAQALEAYGAQTHSALLRWGLWAPEPVIRALSAALLSQTHASDLTQVLLPLLMDSALEVRETVAYALYQATESPFWELLAGLYQALSQDNHTVFQAALTDLWVLPEPVLEEKTRYLLSLYDVSADVTFRHDIIQGLKQAQAFSAAQVFIERLLQRPSEAEVASLIDVLGSWKVRDAYAAVKTYFSEDAHRYRVAQAMAEIAPEEKVWLLFLAQEQLSGAALQSLFVRLSAVKEATSFLVSEALQTEVMERRQAALLAIYKRSQRDPGFDLSAFLVRYLTQHSQPEEETLDVVIQMSEALKVLPESCFEVIKAWLSSPAESVRRGALYALKSHAADYKTELQPLLNHDLWFVRMVSLELLAALQSPELIHAIRRALTDRDRDVRVLAVSLLGQMHVPERLDWLVDVLENGYREIRAVAARGLTSFSDHVTVTEPLTVALMEDEAAEVRQAALETLAHLRIADFAEVLDEALAFEEDIQVWISGIRCLAVQNPALAQTWAQRLLQLHPTLSVVQELLPLFEQHLWSTEPLQGVLTRLEQGADAALQTKIDALRLGLLPLICRTNPELAQQSLYHDNVQVVAAVILHLPEEIVVAEKIWQKALWRKNHRDVRQAIYLRWPTIEALWDDFSELARQETDLSLRQIVIEQLGQVNVKQALPLCESLFLKHTEQTQSPLVWSLATYLQQPDLENEILQSLFRVMSRSQNTVREQVFTMLTRVQGQQAYRLLQLCLESWDQELVFSAIRVLPAWGNPALTDLLALWQDAQLGTQMEILMAVGRFSADVLSEAFPRLQDIFSQALLVDILRPFVLEVLNHWQEEGAGARPFLLNTLKDLNEVTQRTLRYDLYAGLARLYPQEPIWAIFQAANSQLASMRVRALIRLNTYLQQDDDLVITLDWHALLSYFSEDEAYTVRLSYYELGFPNQSAWRHRLIRALRYDVLPVQQMCVYRLGHYFDAVVQEELLTFWSEAKYALKETLLAVLSQQGMPGLSLDALSDHSSTVRKSAICVAGQYRLQAAESHLLACLKNDASDEVREACCWALGFLPSDKAYYALCDVVISRHFSLQYQALSALRYHDSAALFLLDHLSSVQEDRELLMVALDSLNHLAHQLPSHASPAPLIAAIELIYDSDVRALGLEVLKKMSSAEALRYLQQRHLV